MWFAQKSFAVAALAATVAPSVAAQDTPPELQDLVGVRAPGGETELGSRGFTNVGGRQGDDRTYTFWWNPREQRCVTVATMQGRYASITSSPAADCVPPRGERG